MFWFWASAKEKLILIDTKIITNSVFDAINMLWIGKESTLSSEEIIEICKIVFSDPQITNQLSQFDNMFTKKSVEILLTVSEYWKENDMYVYPWTIADLLARWYATALLWWHTPSDSLTNKMVKEVKTKFINLWKL
jgi:hypothetical protein